MKKSMKKALVIIALALLACVACILWLASRRNETDDMVAEKLSSMSGGAAFEVRVVVPRTGLPFGGILPDWVVKKYDLTPRELRFDHMSSGAKVGVVRSHWIQLFADDWDLFIEIDGEGKVTPETHLVFPLGLGGRRLKLDCRSADHPAGYLRITTRPGTERLDGSFLVELATCKNAESGKTTNWPPAPLTVRGSFASLPPGRR